MNMVTVLRRFLPAAASLALLALVLLPSRPAAGSGGVTDGALSPQRVQDASGQTVRIHLVSSQTRCLRVVAAGVRTRNSSSPTAGGVITLPAGPTAANIVWAGLYWEILSDTPPANAVTLNGNAVAPVALPVSASPCWTEINAYPYFADVTALVAPGPNTVAGLDDSGVLRTGPESEGASLVVIYKSTQSEACEIIVTDGNDLSGPTYDNPLPVTCPSNLPATLYFIGADGQGPTYGVATDNQAWNGAALGDGDDFDASDPATAGAAPDLSWDTDPWSVSTGPPNTASLVAGSDCINWLATVLEVGVHTSDACAVTPTHRSTWGQLKSIYR